MKEKGNIVKSKRKQSETHCEAFLVSHKGDVRNISGLLLFRRHTMENGHQASGGRSRPEGTGTFRLVRLPPSLPAKKMDELFIKEKKKKKEQ